jgi:DNA polymerase
MPDGANFSVSVGESTVPIDLFLDIETRSACNLLAQGLYVYAEHPSTQILCVSYAIDDSAIKTWYVFNGDPLPADLHDAILNPRTRFIAHNASFERVLLVVVGRRLLLPELWQAFRCIERWSCTAARSALMGLPRALDNVARALGLAIQKDQDGYALMKRMCAPNSLDFAGRWTWIEDADSVKRLGEYCEVDVAVERLVHREVPPLSPFEHAVWATSERMNDRGISVDPVLLQKLIFFTADAEKAASEKISQLTDGFVPKVTNAVKLREWVVMQGLEEANDLDAKGKPNGVGKWMLQRWLDDETLPPLLREVLTVRKEGGKSSTKKFVAIAGRLNLDNRIRGTLLYCGAASTSRFCLAEGALVLVKLPTGEITERPIESVGSDDLVWDGDAWVAHEGVVFSGEKEVIEHDGVSATAEHTVYLSDTEHTTLGDAVAHSLPLFKGKGDPWAT